MDTSLLLDYLFAGILGAAVSSGELIARYKDAPGKTLLTGPALIYMLLNFIASLSALVLVESLNLTFGAAEENARFMQILVAGFGALALFRSSFFTIRIDDKDIGVGPSSFLQVALDAADRAVDRKRATVRAETVKSIMENVDFEKAFFALPTYSNALMQNLNEDAQKEIITNAATLFDFDVDNDIKAQVLGLSLMDYVGEDVLKAAVTSLKHKIKCDPEQKPKKPTAVIPRPLEKTALPGEQPSDAAPPPPADLEQVFEQVKAASAEPSPAAPAQSAAPEINLDKILNQVREENAAEEESKKDS
jgi:hypothetical protein